MPLRRKASEIITMPLRRKASEDRDHYYDPPSQSVRRTDIITMPLRRRASEIITMTLRRKAPKDKVQKTGISTVGM
jgi:hypothetical protein